MGDVVRQVSKIKKYKQERGYGFLENGCIQNYRKDIFFHISEFPEGTEIRIGDAVEFELDQAEKGIKAIRCKIVNPIEADV